jgi:hypothetical protein
MTATKLSLIRPHSDQAQAKRCLGLGVETQNRNGSTMKMLARVVIKKKAKKKAYLVQFFPYAFALPGFEQWKHGLVCHAFIVPDNVHVFCFVILFTPFIGLLSEFGKVTSDQIRSLALRLRSKRILKRFDFQNM